MTVVTEIAIFDLLPGVDLTDHGSVTLAHLQTAFNVLKQQKGFLQLFWVTNLPGRR